MELDLKQIKEAAFFEKLKDEIVRCKLCPWNCVLRPGQRGLCGVRENREGKLYTLNYGFITALNVDPMEKKPLFHYYPGSPIVSISTVGCNLKCPWCQNYTISQRAPEEVIGDYMSPGEIINYMKSIRVPFLAFTYNEPIIWYEYVLDVARAAKRMGYKNVLITNGHINMEPLEELVPYIDAANVDIKSFNETTYLKVMRGHLKAILEATEYMHEKGVHIETTYLVVPRVNDDEEEFKQLVKWQIEELSPDVPLHISRFFPMYKYIDREATPITTVERLWKIARKLGLNYVYVGNVPGHKGENTYCPECGKLLIKRMGFWITEWNITKDNKCKYCGTKIAIVGKRWRETRFGYFI